MAPFWCGSVFVVLLVWPHGALWLAGCCCSDCARTLSAPLNSPLTLSAHFPLALPFIDFKPSFFSLLCFFSCVNKNVDKNAGKSINTDKESNENTNDDNNEELWKWLQASRTLTTPVTGQLDSNTSLQLTRSSITTITRMSHDLRGF